jgi:hypothetical protein
MAKKHIDEDDDFEQDFDNDNEDKELVNIIDSAATLGWKVKITYHETAGKNWFSNRGETNHFVNSVEVLDRNPIATAFGTTDKKSNTNSNCDCKVTGKTIDTIYVIIDKSK